MQAAAPLLAGEWVLDIDLDYFTTRNPFTSGLTTPGLGKAVADALV